MIKTKNGIMVRVRKNGNEASMPLPSALHIKKGSQFLIKKNKNGNLICTLQHKRRNFFDDPKLNRKDFLASMKACNLPNDQGISVGKEL